MAASETLRLACRWKGCLYYMRLRHGVVREADYCHGRSFRLFSKPPAEKNRARAVGGRRQVRRLQGPISTLGGCRKL